MNKATTAAKAQRAGAEEILDAAPVEEAASSEVPLDAGPVEEASARTEDDVSSL